MSSTQLSKWVVWFWNRNQLKDARFIYKDLIGIPQGEMKNDDFEGNAVKTVGRKK
jgi:hypothetical protein